jgi:hypothetical protein
MAQALVFDFYNSIIEVPIPDTSLDIQYLIDSIRDQEEELSPGINFAKIADASGKDDLGGGVYTAITVRLLDSWRVRFEARSGPDTTQCTIGGGNLVGGLSGNPVAPSAYTQVVRLSSASGTISVPNTASDSTNLKYLISSISGKQKSVGDIFYWDPTNGSDSNTGLTPTAPVATFAKAHDLATDANHDIIFALSTDASGITTVTETITITKDTLQLRGPGHTFQLIPTATTDDTISINANDVEVSGLYVSTAATGSMDAIEITGDNALIKDVWITDVRGHGIDITSSNRSTIDTCAIENTGSSGTGNGINAGTDTTQMSVYKSIIFDGVNGIVFSGTGIADNKIEDSLIYGNSAYGVNIGTGVANTTLRGGNTIVNNTTGNTLDNGTDSYVETPAGGASASEIADAVWDEVITTSHQGTGAAGKMLKDTKTKATLASIK